MDICVAKISVFRKKHFPLGCYIEFFIKIWYLVQCLSPINVPQSRVISHLFLYFCKFKIFYINLIKHLQGATDLVILIFK